MAEEEEQKSPKIWPWFIGIFVLMVLIFIIGIIILNRRYGQLN
jgi:uncharacterized membrane protein YadS